MMNRFAVAPLFLVLTAGASLHGQVDPWHLVAGVGGITGEPLAHRAAFVGALGRDVAAWSTLRLGGELTVAHLPTGQFACPTSENAETCDFRALDHWGALSIVGAISPSVGMLMPYFRANMGAWVGRDADASGSQASRESGFTIVGEAGIGVRCIAAGLRVDQLTGVRRGTLHLASIVLRSNF